MTRLLIAPIVEGHGEVGSVRILLERIWFELLQETRGLEVLAPIRQPRDLLLRDAELRRARDLAAMKLRSAVREEDRSLALLLLDSDRKLPCELAPRLLQILEERGDVPAACVLAHPEYETWFVAAAPSLLGFLELKPHEPHLAAPEAGGVGKGWLEERFRAPKYSETLDQPRLTRTMDLRVCRERSPSFAKLCRVLESQRDPPPS